MLIFCFTASNLKLPFIINLRFVWLHCTLLNWVRYIEGYNIVPVSWDETGEKGYGFSSSTMKFYTLPSFSQHDQCEFLTLPSFVQHSQKFLFTILIQHTGFLHNYMWVFNITLFGPAFPNSFCLFTTTWLKGWKRR